MANIQGINVAAPVVPYTTDDVYASHYALYGKGGFRSMSSLAQRNAIPSDRLEVGMIVSVLNYPTAGTNTWFELINVPTGPLSNTDWRAIDLGSSGPAGPAAVVDTPFFVTTVTGGSYNRAGFYSLQTAINSMSGTGQILEIYDSTPVAIQNALAAGPSFVTGTFGPSDSFRKATVVVYGKQKCSLVVQLNNEITITGPGTLLNTLIVDGGDVIVNDFRIAIAYPTYDVGIQFNSGSLTLENSSIRGSQSEGFYYSISTNSVSALVVNVRGTLNYQSVSPNITLDVQDLNFGGGSSQPVGATPITYAVVSGIVNTHNDVFSPGTLYKITNRVMQGTGTTGDVYVKAVSAYALEPEGILETRIPDYSNNGVWPTTELKNADRITIHLGKTWMFIGDVVGSQEPGVSPEWVIYIYGDSNGNFLQTYDAIVYDPKNDWILERRDSKNNVIKCSQRGLNNSLYFGGDSSQPYTINQWPWGANDVSGNFIVDSVFGNTLIYKNQYAYIVNNTMHGALFVSCTFGNFVDLEGCTIGQYTKFDTCSFRYLYMFEATDSVFTNCHFFLSEHSKVTGSNINNFGTPTNPNELKDTNITSSNLSFGINTQSLTFNQNIITQQTLVFDGNITLNNKIIGYDLPGHAIKDHYSTVVTRKYLNFLGASVSVQDDLSRDITNVIISDNYYETLHFLEFTNFSQYIFDSSSLSRLIKDENMDTLEYSVDGGITYTAVPFGGNNYFFEHVLTLAAGSRFYYRWTYMPGKTMTSLRQYFQAPSQVLGQIQQGPA